MCLSPVTVPTTSRYISLKYRDRFVNQFPCGHCAECVGLAQNQWSFRANYEFDDLPDSGYIMFDCLTYRDSDLPHLSDFWTFLDKRHEDYPCFNHKHLRKFLQLLRTRLIRSGFDKNSFRYYYACEYGTSTNEGCTHRPHIHLMLYIYDTRIKPVFLSNLIAKLWSYGRTDGVPYKGSLYVMSHNVVRKDNYSSRLRTIQYITKYLAKSCQFQKELNKRVAVVMRRMADYVATARPDEGYYPLVTADEWLDSELARRERLRLLRMVNQYHRSSQHFGESALRDIDYNELLRSGCVWMPHSDKVKVPVPLSTYYKRKLFYELVEIDGARYWALNELGFEYNKLRQPYIIQKVADKLNCLSLHAGIKVDSLQLADYVLNYRGRLSAKTGLDSVYISEKLSSIDLYNYSSVSDKLQFNERGLSLEYLGNPQSGYISNRIKNRISLSDFIKKYVYFEPDKERLLERLFCSVDSINKGRQLAFELQQRLNNINRRFASPCVVR